jgi:hypothetical protein
VRGLSHHDVGEVEKIDEGLHFDAMPIRQGPNFCVPVVTDADMSAQGNWSFYIYTKVMQASHVKINGLDCSYDIVPFQKVIVPNTYDYVVVTFEVTAGYDSTVTVTKELIAELRSRGEYPIIAAWGGSLTYDVDAVAITPLKKGEFNWKTCKHLVGRGLYHSSRWKAEIVHEDLPFDTMPVRQSPSFCIPVVKVEEPGT